MTGGGFAGFGRPSHLEPLRFLPQTPHQGYDGADRNKARGDVNGARDLAGWRGHSYFKPLLQWMTPLISE